MSIRRSALATLTSLVLAACTAGGSTPGSSTSGTSKTTAEATSTAGSATASSPTPQPPSCVQRVAATLTPREKAAQLVLVAMTPSSIGTAGAQIAEGNASGVFLLGGWSGIPATAQATGQIHALSEKTGGIGTWVAIDQEGGEVQQLRGPNVTDIPSAVTQGKMDPTALQAEAAIWASALADAGADINLAPVADVVPADIGTKNAPIGLYGRQYGSSPEAVTGSMLAFLHGMQAGGVIPTVKHFPGIGRILGNTDTTAVGIADDVMTSQDPFLQPFQAAIDAGAPVVMVSTARYPNLDPQNQAAFSEPIITGLLRGQMGFGGVVISDDLGAAASVEGVPVGERFTRFVGAGGDVVLTAQPSQAATMNAAAVAKYTADPQFAAGLDAAVERVLTLKDQHDLLPCSA